MVKFFTLYGFLLKREEKSYFATEKQGLGLASVAIQAFKIKAGKSLPRSA